MDPTPTPTPTPGPSATPLPVPLPAPPSKPSGGFDVAAARAAGYSDDEILGHLTASRKFDIEGALKSGYSKPEIIDHLASTASDQAGGGFSKFAENYWHGVSPLETIKTLAHLVAHPVDTWNADAAAREAIRARSDEASAAGEKDRALGNAIAGRVPFVGTAVGSAGEKIRQGDVAGGLGDAAALITNIAAPAALKAVAPRVALPETIASKGAALAERIYARGLKAPPSTKPATLANAARAGVAEGLPATASGVSDLGSTTPLTGAFRDVVQKMDEATLANPRAATTSFPAQPVVDAIDRVKARFDWPNQVDPSMDLGAIDRYKQALVDKLKQPDGSLRDLTTPEAIALKRGTSKLLGERAFGELQTSLVEAQKSLAHQLGQDAVKAFPELSEQNARYGGLKDLQPLLERAVQREGNKIPFGIGDMAVAAATKAATGSNPAAAALGFAHKVWTSPAVRTRAAILLSKAANVSVPTAASQIQGYINALGQAADNTGAPIPAIP